MSSHSTPPGTVPAKAMETKTAESSACDTIVEPLFRSQRCLSFVTFLMTWKRMTSLFWEMR